MSSDIVLLLDTPNLSHRNWHAMGGVTSHGMPTVYGLLRDLGNLSKAMMTNRFVFCFDGPNLLRREIYPEYKMGRRNNVPSRERIRDELMMLKDQVLPDLGYKNILYHEQAEADDLIAVVCKMNRPKSIQFVIVSTDQDFNQLLGKNTTIWSPATKCLITEKTLFARHGLTPSQWVEFKSIIGDGSDNIKGVEGVGPIRGVQYMLDKMDRDSPSYAAIQEATEIRAMGRRLNTLPLPDLDFKGFDYGIEQDNISHEVWDAVMQKYDLSVLIGKRP